MIQIVYGNIADHTASLCINSTNRELYWEDLTVNGAIHTACGNELIEVFTRLHDIHGDYNIGDLIITKGFNSHYDYIFHVISPWLGSGNEIEHLCALYDKIFQNAIALNINTIILPVIGTGTFLLPFKFGFDILHEYSTRYEKYFKCINICVHHKKILDNIETRLKYETEYSDAQQAKSKIFQMGI